MQRVNPKFVLRNWVAEHVIRAAADHRDFSQLERVLSVLRRPFDEQPGQEELAAEPAQWGRHLVVSCSS